MDSIYSIVYASSARWHLSDIELEDILRKSRLYNESHAISGLLLYADGNFLQVLEGDKQAVQKLYDRIEIDNRHCGVIRLMELSSEERNFEDWSMGYRQLSRLELDEAIPGFNGFLSNEATPKEFKDRINSSVWTLLTSFRKIVNV